MYEQNDQDSRDDENIQAQEQTVTEQGYIMRLTENEACFLDDCLTLMVLREKDEQKVYSMRPVERTAGLAAPLELMVKIGKAVAFTSKPENLGKEYVFAIDISELYMIREVASSSISIDGESVGINLKRKVCALLYTTALEEEIRDTWIDLMLTSINLDIQTSAIDETND